MNINLAKDALTGNYVKPNIYLCEVDKSIICKLETTNTKASLKFNSYSEISFEVARIYNDLITGETKIFPFYDKIEALRLIKVDGVGYFEIQSAEISSDGIKESKNVTAYSLEYTLTQKYLEDLYNDGTIGSIDANYIEDVYGGSLSGKEYPHVTLVNNDKRLSLTDIILEKAYGWSFDHIDASLKTKNRQFNIDRTSIYDFIMNDLCKMFNCYAVFDTVYNKINLYAEALTETIKVTEDNVTEFKLKQQFQRVKTVSNNGYKMVVYNDAENKYDTDNKYDPINGVLTLAKAPKVGDILEVVSEDLTPWETDVFISFDNLSQEVSVNYNADDIKTVLTVEYDEGKNVREVNLGLPYITDLSYYNTTEWMGKELYDMYKLYNEDCDSKKSDYMQKVKERLEFAEQLDYEENRISLSYSVARDVHSGTTTSEENGEVYYVRTGEYPNYSYAEKTLPDEYKPGVTYYKIGSEDLTEDKIVSLRKALGYYFKEDSMEKLDELIEYFEFTNNNINNDTIVFGSKIDNNYTQDSLLYILNQHKGLGAKTKENDNRNPDLLYENMDIESDDAKTRDTAIKTFLHQVLDQFGLNMLNVLKDTYVKAQDGFISRWYTKENGFNESDDMTDEDISKIEGQIKDSAKDYPNYYPILLILDVLKNEIGESIYSDPPAEKSTGRYVNIDPLTSEINRLISESTEISNGLIMYNWFYNYYLKQYEATYQDENTRKLKAEESTNALLIHLNPFLREDELTLEDIVSTDLDGIDGSLSIQNDALSAAYLELQKLSQPQLSFSMTMANIFALPEFEPIIKQFKLGNLIKVAIRPDYIKQSRLLQIDMGLDDFSDFSCEFGELTNLSTQSDIHADLLSNAASAGKQVATYSSYWTQGADTASTTDLKIQQGLLDATTKIKAIDGTQGVTIDKYGIKCQKIDPTTGAVDDKQAWFVNNSLLFTSDGWKTSRTGIGEFHADGRDFYGVIAEAIYSGYIEGTTIAGGKLYSTNYNPDPSKAAGTYINLETGDFEIGGRKFVYDNTDNKLTLDGVSINWNTLTEKPEISNINGLNDALEDLGEGIEGAKKASADEILKLNNTVKDYLGRGGSTYIDETHMISPYIGGGYLHIVNGNTSLTMDPGNLQSTNFVFQVTSNGETKVGIKKDGSAEFKGHIKATSIELIGGAKIPYTKLESAPDLSIYAKQTDLTETKNKIAAWCYENNTTLIDGASIYTGNITALGEISSGSFRLGNGKFVVTNDGVLTAKSGTIGGWIIDTDKLYMKYKPSKAEGALEKDTEYYTTLKANYEVAFAVGSTSEASAKYAATKIGHNGNMWVGRYKNDSGGHLYAFKVIVKGSDDDDDDKNDNDANVTAIYMRGPVYTESALFRNRIYLNNGTALRGQNKNTTHTTNYDTNAANSQVIAYVDDTGDNNVIIGHSNNTGKTIIRSGAGTTISGSVTVPQVRSSGSLYLMCNGETNTDSIYTLQFARLNFGDDKNPQYVGCLRPHHESGTGLQDDTKKDSATFLGSSSYRWKGIYVYGSPMITSDRNKKKNITSISNKYLDLFDCLNPVTYQMINGDRIHVGFISQDIEDSLEKVGLTAEDFGGFCKDVKVKDDDGNTTPILDEDGNQEYEYALRYEEFIALNTAKIKQLEQRLNQAIEVIDKQQEIIEELKNKMV